MLCGLSHEGPLLLLGQLGSPQPVAEVFAQRLLAGCQSLRDPFPQDCAQPAAAARSEPWIFGNVDRRNPIRRPGRRARDSRHVSTPLDAQNRFRPPQERSLRTVRGRDRASLAPARRVACQPAIVVLSGDGDGIPLRDLACLRRIPDRPLSRRA